MITVPTYATLTIPKDVRASFVEVSELRLHLLIRSLLEGVVVDEGWYRTRYGDVNDAIRSRAFPSGKAHYVAVGYFEDRLPRYIAVDDAWYLKMNPDVVEAIQRGDLGSAQDHFEMAGFREGRAPAESWSL